MLKQVVEPVSRDTKEEDDNEQTPLNATSFLTGTDP